VFIRVRVHYQNNGIIKVLIPHTTGCAGNVRFLISIGDRIVRNAIRFVLPVVLCRDLKIGSVPSVATSTMLVGWNATDAGDPKIAAIDEVFITEILYFYPKLLFNLIYNDQSLHAYTIT
jgi:hypothetical protein